MRGLFSTVGMAVCPFRGWLWIMTDGTPGAFGVQGSCSWRQIAFWVAGEGVVLAHPCCALSSNWVDLSGWWR